LVVFFSKQQFHGEDKLKYEPGAQIVIVGLANLRELGGWMAADGRSVAAGKVFRSTDLDRLDQEGIGAVARLGVRTVVDLRTEAEREMKPDRLPRDVSGIVCDVLGDAPDAAPAQLPKIMADPKSAAQILGGGQAEAMFERGYRDLVSLPSALEAYHNFFVALADDTRRPLLFHCTTGKDRTGWAAAVLLTVLGVSREDVMRDYLLTNQQLLPALQPIVDRFAEAGGDPTLLNPILGVRPGYLLAAFDEVQSRFGSMEKYLGDGLRLTKEMRSHLRASLTEVSG